VIPDNRLLMNSARFESRQNIEAKQLAKLRSLLTTLAQGNRFYADKFRDAGTIPEVSTLEDLQRKIPFTLKQEIVEDQRRYPPYGSNLSYPLARYKRFSQTSATSGRPLRWLDTQENWNWMLNCWVQVFEAAGITDKDRLFFAFSFAPFLGFWTAFEAAASLGSLCIPGGGLSSVARLGIMMDNGVTVLCCTPTYALRLGEVAKEEDVDLTATGVEKILVAGEPGGSVPSVRSKIETLWGGARVIDHHGMTEIGPVSYQCPSRSDVLHVLESDYIAELIDPQSGQPAGPGQTGELVLTNLGRLGSPLLRYRTGDLVKLDPVQRCECRSYEMALQGGILGRTDDMVTVRGVNLYPSAVDEVVRACDEVGEYRVVIRTQRELAELTLEVEPTSNSCDPAKLADRLKKRLEKAFALRISASILPPGSLPRFEMKARRWVRL
jgi:phenylacetate-CoA ligase